MPHQFHFFHIITSISRLLAPIEASSLIGNYSLEGNVDYQLPVLYLDQTKHR